MDAITRIAVYFPTQSLTSFWILANLIIDNNNTCNKGTQQMVTAVLIIGCFLVLMASFTDTYTASNRNHYMVLLIPFYGPVCFNLPTDYDKDRVYEFFYLKGRDYVRAFVSVTCFILIVLFINPIAACLFPKPDAPGETSIAAVVVRTLPVVVALIGGLMMLCLGQPRQSLGFQNVEETCPPLEKQMGDNPIYHKQGPASHMDHGGYPAQYPGPPTSITEGDEDYYGDGPTHASYNGGRQMHQASMQHAPTMQGSRSYGMQQQQQQQQQHHANGNSRASMPRSPEPNRESMVSQRSMPRNQGGGTGSNSPYNGPMGGGGMGPSGGSMGPGGNHMGGMQDGPADGGGGR